MTAAKKIQDTQQYSQPSARVRALDANLIRVADGAVDEAKGGQLQLEDAERLLASVKDPTNVTRVEKSTLRHIRDHYPLSQEARDRLRTQISLWDGKRFSKGVYLFERVGNQEKVSIVQKGSKKKRRRGRGRSKAEAAETPAEIKPAPVKDPVQAPVEHQEKPEPVLRVVPPRPAAQVVKPPPSKSWREVGYWLLVLSAAALLLWLIGPEAQPLNDLPVTERAPLAPGAVPPPEPSPEVLKQAAAHPAPYQPREFVPLKFGRVHAIQRGDTLWALAGVEYGDPFQWPYILRANPVVDKNPDLLVPGRVVYLPALEEIARNLGADGQGGIAEAYAYAYMAYSNAGKAKAAGYLRRAIQMDPVILKLFNVPHR